MPKSHLKSSKSNLFKKPKSFKFSLVVVVLFLITILASYFINQNYSKVFQTASINKLIEMDPSLASTALEKKAIDKLNNAANADVRAKTPAQKAKAEVDLYVTGSVVSAIAQNDGNLPSSVTIGGKKVEIETLADLETKTKDQLVAQGFLTKDSTGNLISTAPATSDIPETATPVISGTSTGGTQSLNGCVKGNPSGTFGCPYDFAWNDDHDQGCDISVAGFYCWGGERYVINIPSTQRAAAAYFGKVAAALAEKSKTTELSLAVNAQPGNTLEEKLDNYLKSLSVLDKATRAQLLAEYKDKINPSLRTDIPTTGTDINMAALAAADQKAIDDAAIAAEAEKIRIQTAYTDITCGGKIKSGEKCISVSLDGKSDAYRIVSLDFNGDISLIQTTEGSGEYNEYVFGSNPRIEPNTSSSISNIDYINQLDYSGERVRGGGSWASAGCGIMAGAMVFSLTTGESNPYAYNTLLEQHGGVSNLGTGWFDQHEKILEENGFEVVPVYGSTAEKKAQIAEYAKEGIPVWISAYIDNGSGAWIGHHTLAVGIDSETGNIILDDPYYGENYSMPISRFDIDCSKSNCGNGTRNWIMNAVIPPEIPPEIPQ
ncbi:MAG: papain-like cysteine protease family protein [bacterium]